MLEGKIIKAKGGFYYVWVQEKTYFCRARGKFKKQGVKPLVGDAVIIMPLNTEEGVIEKILPRLNVLHRPPVANIDKIVIVISVNNPEPDFTLLDRLLICAESRRIQPVICFNKVDLASSDSDFESEVEPYIQANYPVILTSAVYGSGIPELINALKGFVSVFAGPSGAGKSSLLNQVKPGANLKTLPVSKKGERGRQTTRHLELLTVDGNTFVADAPGFTRLDLREIAPEELGDLYPEIFKVRDECRFRNCLHVNEPGCKVKEAVQKGEFAEARYHRYKLFLNELREMTMKGD